MPYETLWTSLPAFDPSEMATVAMGVDPAPLEARAATLRRIDGVSLKFLADRPAFARLEALGLRTRMYGQSMTLDQIRALIGMRSMRQLRLRGRTDGSQRVEGLDAALETLDLGHLELLDLGQRGLTNLASIRARYPHLVLHADE